MQWILSMHLLVIDDIIISEDTQLNKDGRIEVD